MFDRKIEKFESEDAWKAARALVLTSTEVPALFGVSPYTTEFELFHRKAQKLVVDIESNERMKWGQRLQTVIGEGIAAERGWLIRPMSEFITLPQIRLAASFDFEVVVTFEGAAEPCILEVKNVDSLQFKEGWLIEGDDIEAPPHIEIQVQVQMLVAGLRRAFIGVLVGGNRVVVLEREADPVVQKAIIAKVAQFWDRVDRGVAPSPDFSRDSDFICSLYHNAASGKVVDVSGDAEVVALVQQHKSVSERLKILETEKDALKAKLFMRLGDAEKAVGPDFSISLSIVKGGPVAYTRSDYRNFRIFPKKEKK